jgi:DNA primase
MDFVEQVKSSVDIVKVVGEYVRLRKAGGARYIGLCPFHNEKTPSFGVHPVHQFYKCFGCGEGGDVLTFIMKIDGLSFFEALKLLAERNGIPMPKRQEYSDPETRQRAAIFQMHEIAVEFFRDILRGAAGAEARAYLDKRGVAPAIAEQFGIGYADGTGRSLVRKLQEHSFNAEQLEASGLVGRRDDGTFYDRFRHRLMFPIHSETGKAIAFGGRALDPNEQAKYLNSPETPIYKKGSVLYNMHRAKEGIRKNDRTLLVEGYMDVIGVWAAGIREVVATCGTALTQPQIKMMKRHSPRIVLNFDPDAAGSSAAERNIGPLLDEGMRVRILELDAELDPDEYCKQRGPDAYRARMESAKDYFTWLADRRRDKFGSGAEGKIAWLKSMLPDIGRVSDRIERLVIAGEVSSYIGITQKEVLEEFRKAVNGRRAEMAPAAPAAVSANEKLLLRLLLANPEAPDELIPGLKTIAAIAQMPTRRIFEAVFAQHDSGGRIGFNEIHDRLNDDDRALLAATVLLDETSEAEQSIEQGIACLRSLQAAEVESQRAALKARIKEAERNGNMEEALRLSEELNRIRPYKKGQSGA